MARISSAMLLPSSSAHSCRARGERGRPRFSRLSRVALSIAAPAWARRALIPVTAVYRDDAAAESVVAAALQSRVLHHLHESLRVRRLSDRKSTRLNSSHLGISYAVFCLKKKNKIIQ